jgi:hypothetical protein
VQSPVNRLLLLIVIALGVLLLLRPGTISQLKGLADNISGRSSASGPTTQADPQPAFPAPISSAAPAIPGAQPSQANTGDPGETNVSDETRGAGPEKWPPPLEIRVPATPAEPGPAAAGNVTVESLGLPAPPSEPAGQPTGENQVGAGPEFRPTPVELPPPPTPQDNPLRGMPPPPEQNSGFAPSQDAGLPGGPRDAGPPRVPQDAGHAPQSPNAGLPPPPDNRPPDNRAADAYRPAPVNPQVASGPIQQPPPASRPQASPPYVPPLLEPIRVASLDPKGPSFPPGATGAASAPGANGAAGALDGSTSAGAPGAMGSGSLPGTTGSGGTAGTGSVPNGLTSAGPTTGPPPAGGGPAPASARELCKSSQEVARVGSQVILASDLNVAFNIWVEKQKKSKQPIPPEQIEKQRTQIEILILRQMTEEIVVYQDILRQVPEEALKNVRDKVNELFETEELPQRLKSEGVASRAEFEEKLEKLGTSLEREKRTFVQSMLVQQWLQQQVKKDDEVFTPDEIFAYYRQHTAEFEHPARAKWDELMVRKSRHPNRNEAIGRLGHMGNQVLDGAKLNEVARAGSEGSTADKGGLHDWTNKGSLVSQTLEDAIFSLPVGQLSQIIETDLGYHIVRVVQREDRSVTPFLEAQVEIRNKIIRQRKEKQKTDYLVKLHERTPVWTKFDAVIAQQQKDSSPFPR